MNIPFSLCIFSADQPLGKVDKGSLSQQTLMELLIEGITDNKYKICYSTDSPEDISEWEGLVFNDANEITEIDWGELRLAGSIDLQWLPLSSEKVNFGKNALNSTVDLTCLPDLLKFLYLHRNEFIGTVDLTKLPPGMVSLDISRNALRGRTDFSHLPQSLKHLKISNTHISGDIYTFNGILYRENSNVIDRRRKKLAE